MHLNNKRGEREDIMFKVTYKTMNDTYTKRFMTQKEANRFCGLIRKLYPEQKPVVEIEY